MKKSTMFVRVGAVSCSALLMAGFVAYRSGAFAWSSAANIQQPAPAAASPADSAQAPFVMSGSKYSFPPPSITKIVPPTQSSGPKPPTIIGSSKSLAPLIPFTPSQTAQTQQQPTPPKK